MNAVTVVTTLDGFDALKDQWNGLQDACANTSLFLSWEWQRLWWRHYSQGRRLHIIAVWQGDRLVGLLPMYVEWYWARGLLPIRKFCLIGSGGDTAPDDLDPLIDPEEAMETARLLADAVLSQFRGWDLLSLPDLNPQAPFTRRVLDTLEGQGAWTPKFEGREVIRGELPQSWDAYLGTLGSHRRQGLRYRRRNFEKEESAEVLYCDDLDALDAAFERLADLHRRRWVGRTDQPAFSTETYLNFHRSLMRSLLERGMLRLLELRIDGKTIAMRYGYRIGDIYFDLQSGFDPDYRSYSPGELSIGYAIERSIDEGCKYFDMLRGDYGHKRQFFTTHRDIVTIRVIKGWYLQLLAALKDKLTRRLSTTSVAPDRAD